MAAVGLGRKLGQAEKAACLVECVAKAVEPTIEGDQGDQVEQIAVLAGGGVGPFAGGAFAGAAPAQPDEEAAAGRVPDIADDPLAAFTPAV